MKTRILYEACPLCQSKDFAQLRTGDCSKHPLYQPPLDRVMRWMGCADCGHVFTNGYLTPEAAAVVFSATNDSQKLGTDIERQRPVSARIVEKVRIWRQAGKWLDVGIGNGSLLFTAEEYGYHVVGVDLREKNVGGIRGLGYEAYCCPFEELIGCQYNVISMADVLEHMPDPRSALIAASKMLSGSGVLFLSMPNMDSRVWKYLDATGSNPYWNELEHYHNFGFARLSALLEESGFTVCSNGYGISERYRACMEVIAIKKGK